jgi:hypothetical protein
VSDAISQQGKASKPVRVDLSTMEAKNTTANKPSVSERDPELMSKAIDYIKSQTDKKKAFDFFMSKKGDQLTQKQIEGIMKFVR